MAASPPAAGDNTKSNLPEPDVRSTENSTAYLPALSDLPSLIYIFECEPDDDDDKLQIPEYDFGDEKFEILMRVEEPYKNSLCLGESVK